MVQITPLAHVTHRSLSPTLFKRFEFESFGDNNVIKMSLSALLLTVVVSNDALYVL